VTAESDKTRRVCLLADIDGYEEQQPVAQSGLTLRMKGVIGATLKSAGVDSTEAWRQDRGSRQLALLPVAADAAIVVPLLARGLLAELEKDRAIAAGPPLRVRVAVTRDAVTQVRASYVGRAIVSATRLLDSPALRAEFSGDPAAPLALILSDGVHQAVLARGADFPLDRFHQVSVGRAEQGWQVTGWVRACPPGSLKPPPRRIGKMIIDNIPPTVAAVPEGLLTVLDAMSHRTADTGDNEMETVAEQMMAGHPSAGHGTGAEHPSPGYESHPASGPGASDHRASDHGASAHAVSDHGATDQSTVEAAYIVESTHAYAYEDNGHIHDYGVQSVYDASVYEVHDHDSSGDHPGVV
jgi:hypothetical protein